jgi:hypothetical protein
MAAAIGGIHRLTSQRVRTGSKWTFQPKSLDFCKSATEHILHRRTDPHFRGDSSTCHHILSGTHDLNEYDEDVRLLLKHMDIVDKLRTIPLKSTISNKEFASKLKVWKESTTISPSGLHLGHFKALIARHFFFSTASDDELTASFRAQRNELNRKQADIFELHLSLLNYSLERGYSYKRWQTIANTILFKDSDNVCLHRTRVILIYKADFNVALGV